MLPHIIITSFVDAIPQVMVSDGESYFMEQISGLLSAYSREKTRYEAKRIDSGTEKCLFSSQTYVRD